MVTTVSAFGLEFFSPLESGFPWALHLQSTVELVLQVMGIAAKCDRLSLKPRKVLAIYANIKSHSQFKKMFNSTPSHLSTPLHGKLKLLILSTGFYPYGLRRLLQILHRPSLNWTFLNT